MRLFRSRRSMEEVSRMANSQSYATAGRAGALAAIFVALVLAVPLAIDSRAAADTCPNAELRKGVASQLPGCRAYEQVSPVDKNGGDIRGGRGNDMAGSTVSRDGSKALYESLTEFAGGTNGGSLVPTPYLSRRGSAGWETVATSSRPEPVAAGASIELSSIDLDRSILKSSGVMASDPPTTDVGELNVYSRNNITDITSPFLAIHTQLNQFHSVAASPDVDHVVFAAGEVLVAGPGIPPSESTAKVYEKTGGQTRLVSVLPDGTPVPGEARPGFSQTSTALTSSLAGAVSDDGRHIFFSTFEGDTPSAIYRRTDGATTAFVSPSKLTPADPEGPRGKQFEFATADGQRVFFSSPELLTDDANTGPGPVRPGNDLYRYDISTDDLVDVSATPGGNGAQVVKVMGAGDAGDHVYYVAFGEVVPGDGPGGDPDPVPGEPNLYLWEDDGSADGVTRFIATLSQADSSNWFRTDGTWTARTSADGETLLFQSEAAIAGGGAGGITQIYRYDASGVGGLECVSCNPFGDPPLGPSTIRGHLARESAQIWELPHSLSDDGQRVFFTSQDDLVRRDSNGETDAYMWEDGQVSLLTTGTSSRPSYFFNASADGDDAFILTDTPLVPQDIDDLVDLYDVRVGGGFAAPTTDGCSGDDCQGEASAPPATGPTGSADLDGRGDVTPLARQAIRIKRLTRAQRGRLARGRKVGVRIRLNRRAKVVAILRGRIAGRQRVVARGSARSKPNGTATVNLRLNRGALRQLERVGSLRLVLKVSTPGGRPRTTSLRLNGIR